MKDLFLAQLCAGLSIAAILFIAAVLMTRYQHSNAFIKDKKRIRDGIRLTDGYGFFRRWLAWLNLTIMLHFKMFDKKAFDEQKLFREFDKWAKKSFPEWYDKD